MTQIRKMLPMMAVVIVLAIALWLMIGTGTADAGGGSTYWWNPPWVPQPQAGGYTYGPQGYW